MSRSPRRKQIEAARKVRREVARSVRIPVNAINGLNELLHMNGFDTEPGDIEVRLCRGSVPHLTMLDRSRMRWRGVCPVKRCGARTDRVRFATPRRS
jgi:hypothetical protein